MRGVAHIRSKQNNVVRKQGVLQKFVINMKCVQDVATNFIFNKDCLEIYVVGAKAPVRL